MGTTESFLYDDQPPNESSVPQPERTGTVSPSGRQPRSLDSPSEGGGGGSVLAAAGASKKPNRPITRISGVLVGGPKVGKGTLLQILSGKDPFAHEAANEQVPITVATPYAPPAGLPTWNRIKLQVGRVNNGEALPKVDFMVVLIRPTSGHTLEDIQSHTLQVVRSYLSNLEYSPNEHVEKEKNDTTSTTIRTPVCMCVMINFRDLLQDDEETNSHVQQLEHELESFLKNVLRHYTIPSDRLLLQFISTSLLNGYGLNRLHNFIYRTYLQKKQEALEAQLRAVTVQIHNTGEPDFVSYTDFVKLVAPLESDNNQALSRKAAQPPRSSSQQRDSGQNQQSSTRVAGAPSRPHPGQQPQPQPDAASVDKPSRKGRTSAEQAPSNGKNKGPESSRGGAGKGGRRQLYPQTNQPARVGRDALEAFLADSSDEEPPKQKKNSKKNQQTKKNQKDKTPFRHPVDSSDDDDDDFFYDESGRFKNTKAIVRDDEASSSSESSSSSSEDGKRSGAISRPSSPSTTVAKSVPQPKEAVLEQDAKKLPVVPPRRDLKQQQQQQKQEQQQQQQQQQIGAELRCKSEKTTVSSTRISRTPPAPEPKKEQVRMTSDKSDDVSDDDDDLTVEREIGASADDNSDESSRDESQEYAKSADCLPSPFAPTRVYKNTSSTASDTRPAHIEVSEGIAGPSNTQSLSRALSNQKDSDSSDCDAHMNEKEVRPEKNERGVVKADSNPMEKRRVHRYDSSSDEDDTSRGQANATAPIAADEDSDDEEFFISEESKQAQASPHVLGTCTDDDSDSNDDDDEDFFINQDDQKQQDDQEDSGPEPEVAPHSEDNDRINHQSVVEASERASNPTRSSSTPSQLASSPRPDPKEAPKDASPPTSSLVGAAIRRTSSNADDDSDDDDDGDDRNGQEVEGTKPLSPTTATVERNDSPRPSSPPMARSPPSVEHQRTTLSASSSMTTSGELTSTTTTSAAPSSSGISAAALAAIQAAQKEAEAMLLHSDEDDVVGNGGGGSGMRKPKKSKKEKKSKKDRSEKKKKKKDKSKRDRVVDDSSDG